MKRAGLLVKFAGALALVVFQLWGAQAMAQSSYFTSRGCINCHSTPVAATCAGCHQHSGTLTATKNKTTSYAPGETVTITLTSSGARSGWIGVRLHDQTGAEIARSTGNQSGKGGAAVYPAVLSAPAPAAAGTYIWKMAYFGNQNGTGAGNVHGEKSVNVSITVVAEPVADTTKPVVGAFTLPATATSLTVPVSSLTATDNVGVTGYMVTTSATAPVAGAAGWSATVPGGVTAAVAGNSTFYGWAKDAAGNVSLGKSATVTITLPVADTTKPTLTISSLADGTYTKVVTLNVSGKATDAGGIKSVTVNDHPITVNQDGSFSTALTLVSGANLITVIATDTANNQQTDSRTVTYDASAPVLTVATPADNSTTTQSFVIINGTVSETSSVIVTVNNGSPQSAAVSGAGFSAMANLVQGINTIDISATDLAGNPTNAKRTVTLDDSQPTLAVADPGEDITTGQKTLMLKGTFSDTISGVTIAITMDGQTFTPSVMNNSFQQSLTFASAKQYAIVVTATDEAGNSSTVQRNVIYAPQAAQLADTNSDNKVDVFDALLTLQYALELIPHDQANNEKYLSVADVYPLDPVTGKPQGDGQVDVMDALLILQMGVNLISWQ